MLLAGWAGLGWLACSRCLSSCQPAAAAVGASYLRSTRVPSAGYSVYRAGPCPSAYACLPACLSLCSSTRAPRQTIHPRPETRAPLSLDLRPPARARVLRLRHSHTSPSWAAMTLPSSQPGETSCQALRHLSHHRMVTPSTHFLQPARACWSLRWRGDRRCPFLVEVCRRHRTEGVLGRALSRVPPSRGGPPYVQDKTVMHASSVYSIAQTFLRLVRRWLMVWQLPNWTVDASLVHLPAEPPPPIREPGARPGGLACAGSCNHSLLVACKQVKS